MSKEKRLGRGLAALLGGSIFGEEEAAPAAAAPRETVPPAKLRVHTPEVSDGGLSLEGPAAAEVGGAIAADGGAIQIAVTEIDTNPFQPRRVFSESEITSLSESLKVHQMIQPVVVRKVGGRFQLISGERRLRAATQAGWTHVPANIREADDRLVAEIAIVENLQRQDLNPIEKALSFQRYLDQHHCTQEELAGRIKINRSTIANLIRLLELPQTVQDGIATGDLSAGHARALLPLGDDRAQIAFYQRIKSEGLSVRDVEQQVQTQIAAEDGEPTESEEAGGETASTKRPKNNQLAALETELRRALGSKVEIRANARGKGKVTIHFGNHEEFERLRGLLLDHDDKTRHVA